MILNLVESILYGNHWDASNKYIFEITISVICITTRKRMALD